MVTEVMSTVVVTVQERDQMEAAARLMADHDINAVPVVNQTGQCVGILTTRDVMQYERLRREVQRSPNSTLCLDSNQGASFHWPGRQFDEVRFHATRDLETATVNEPVSRIALTMCRRHVHHVVVVNSEQRPIGILSSLDLLGHLTGEPVSRRARLPE
jgi:CBS domain-containing membrane protein